MNFDLMQLFKLPQYSYNTLATSFGCRNYHNP